MKRAYYQNSIPQLRRATQEQVLGELVASSEYDVEKKQRDAWLFQIKQLQQALVVMVVL